MKILMKNNNDSNENKYEKIAICNENEKINM